jgi:hypothetical protein
MTNLLIGYLTEVIMSTIEEKTKSTTYTFMAKLFSFTHLLLLLKH